MTMPAATPGRRPSLSRTVRREPRDALLQLILKNRLKYAARMSYVVPPTRVAAVVRQLRHEIVTGELAPGTLIKDAEVAARLGVSITPVREAIAQLSVEGLIDIAPNRARRVTRMTRKRTLELIDVMAVLACAGFERGIDNLVPSDLELMRRRHREYLVALEAGNTVTATAAAADFGNIVITASGNRELQSLRDFAVARTRRIAPWGVDSPLWSIVAQSHEAILQLLEDGEKQAALQRYQGIYADYRALAEQAPFDAEDAVHP
ncbi:GntR family transcriptional regulator [Actinoplanes sp. NPDC049548]|uniref:GntR family transcriptional regulator n=1 Tax=Actinoplanes sp. NPDC049548 TaxID=3155152 RepID=UPI00341F0562